MPKPINRARVTVTLSRAEAEAIWGLAVLVLNDPDLLDDDKQRRGAVDRAASKIWNAMEEAR